MTDLPDDLRDRAARAAWNAYWGFDEDFSHAGDRFRAVVDAVAEVLAEHFDVGKFVDEVKRANVLSKMWEMDRVRAERAEAELAHVRELLAEAVEDLHDAAGQTSDYLREKWHLDEGLARYKEFLARPVSPDPTT